jgi:hypothetical protein
MRNALMIFALCLGGCDRAANFLERHDPTSIGTVVLFDDNGQIELSAVGKIGPRCWVAWFKGVNRVILRSDGTAVDGILKYRWTLDREGPDDITADQAWFKKNCADPP